jgi:nucleoside 2-deoxyribosyltransferase
MSKTIYLAGPITGLNYGEARYGFREEFTRIMGRLVGDKVACVSPMRGKDALEDLYNSSAITGTPSMDYADVPISTDKAIVTRDFHDVSTCDMMLASFLGAKEVSIGTCVEFGFAHAARTPIILVMEKPEKLEFQNAENREKYNPHIHGFICEIAGYWVDNLEEAARIAASFLVPTL